MSKYSMRPSRRTTLLGGLAVLGAGGLTSITLPAIAVPPGAASVQLRTYNRNWISAPGEAPMNAAPAIARAPETFFMIPLESDNQLRDGALVSLRAQGGKFVSAEDNSGRLVIANREAVGPWETFTLRKIAGQGGSAPTDPILQNGDQIALQASSGLYVVAEGGGGREVLGNRAAVGPWETFTVSNPRRRHVRVEFSSVYCDNTEDVTGADEFYAAGTAKDRFSLVTKTALSKPMSINDGQTKDFSIDPAERIIFDGDVEAASTIALACKFYDQDASNDWNASYTALGVSVGGALATLGPPGVIAGAVLAALTAELAVLFSLDKDDKLGEYTEDLAVADLPFGVTHRNAHLQNDRFGGFGYSTWKYDVDLLITVS